MFFAHKNFVAGFYNNGCVVENGADTEENFDEFIDFGNGYFLGNGVADKIAVMEFDGSFHFFGRSTFALCFKIFSGGFAGSFGFVSYEVNKVVNVKNVAACEDAGDGGHHGFVNDSTVGAFIENNACGTGKFVFRNKTDGKKKGINGLTISVLFWGPGKKKQVPGSALIQLMETV